MKKIASLLLTLACNLTYAAQNNCGSSLYLQDNYQQGTYNIPALEQKLFTTQELEAYLSDLYATKIDAEKTIAEGRPFMAYSSLATEKEKALDGCKSQSELCDYFKYGDGIDMITPRIKLYECHKAAGWPTATNSTARLDKANTKPTTGTITKGKASGDSSAKPENADVTSIIKSEDKVKDGNLVAKGQTRTNGGGTEGLDYFAPDRNCLKQGRDQSGRMTLTNTCNVTVVFGYCNVFRKDENDHTVCQMDESDFSRTKHNYVTQGGGLEPGRTHTAAYSYPNGQVSFIVACRSGRNPLIESFNTPEITANSKAQATCWAYSKSN